MTQKTKSLLHSTILMLSIIYGENAMAQTQQEQNQALISEFSQQVFISKDLSQLDKFMAEHYIQHNPLVAQGKMGFHDFFQNWFESVPDFKYTLKNIIANNNHVWVYGTYSGTQTHEWLGIPATNKSYSFDGVDIFRIENGKLAEHWDVLDAYTLFKQLGTIK